MTEKAQRIIIAKNLKNDREDRGLSKKELAEKTGISELTITNIEASITNLSLSACVKISNVLNIDTWALWADNETRKAGGV